MQQQQYYPAQRKIEVHNGTKYVIDIKRPVLSEEESAHRMENVKREFQTKRGKGNKGRVNPAELSA